MVENNGKPTVLGNGLLYGEPLHSIVTSEQGASIGHEIVKGIL
jgi:hypothetical protein